MHALGDGSSRMPPDYRSHKNKEHSQLKREVKYEVVVQNHGNKKELDVHEQVKTVLLFGKVVV